MQPVQFVEMSIGMVAPVLVRQFRAIRFHLPSAVASLAGGDVLEAFHDLDRDFDFEELAAMAAKS